ELDGPAAEVDHQFADVERQCRDAGAFEIRVAADDAERALIWKGRKSAFAAVGRISPDYIVQDGVIPRTALPEVLRSIAELSAERGVRVANVFHAGDGNLHPLVLFDEDAPAKATDGHAGPAGAGDEVAGVRAALVAAPASVDEAGEVLRVAAAHDLRVVARGGGSKVDWGVAPAAVDLVVDTRRLDRVVE